MDMNIEYVSFALQWKSTYIFLTHSSNTRIVAVDTPGISALFATFNPIRLHPPRYYVERDVPPS